MSMIDLSETELAAGCVGDNLRRYARLISRYYDDALRPVEVNVGQFAILARLAALQSRNVEISVTVLADQLAMDRTTLTRNLKPLRNAGFVELFTGTDRRVKIVGLTPVGTKKFKQAFKLWKSAQKSAVECIGKQTWDSIQSKLRLINNLVS